MVKKKKNRHQQEPVAQNGGDSTESCDENQVNSAGGKCCPHVAKSVDLGKVKKALKSGGLARDCAECSKVPPILADDDELGLSRGLWLCLKCGHQGCGRARQQHALKHHHTPHSDTHALAADTELWNVWCYECDTEVAASFRKKLQECIKYLKQQDCSNSSIANSVARVSEEECKEDVNAEVISMPLSDLTNTTAGSPKKKKLMVSLPSLPRVRGLRNLGNTCFFNAVLQNLAQTPFLLAVLREMSEPGNLFRLSGDGEDLPALEGELGKWGALTETLASTLSELQSAQAEVVDPQRLLNKLTQRCQQFAGGDQHDSHELLRQLLEEVRNEDLKRYKSVILQKFGLRHSDPNEVEEPVRKRARAYAHQAAEQILHPEQVFRGLLVSTLECQDCMHSSQRVETFLELSLPVIANKPQPPVLRRKTSNDEAFDLCGNPAGEQVSKHQQKKERKQARKGRKKQKGHSFDGGDGEPAIAEENTAKNNSGESEQSDADVEDNLEQDIHLSHRGKDVGESGYSSEKAGNEDSAVESPISHPMNGDSALASPDFPADNKESVLRNLEDPPLQNGECISSHSVSPVCNGEVDIDSQFSMASRRNLPLAIIQSSNNQELPLNNTTVMVSNNELSVTISLLPSPPSELGSPVSNRETPSPVSSEVNIDCVSPASTHVHGDCTSPVSDLDRPYSRFAFCHDDDPAEANSDLQMARCSPSDVMFPTVYSGSSDITCKDVELTSVDVLCKDKESVFTDLTCTGVKPSSPDALCKDVELVSVDVMSKDIKPVSVNEVCEDKELVSVGAKCKNKEPLSVDVTCKDLKPLSVNVVCEEKERISVDVSPKAKEPVSDDTLVQELAGLSLGKHRTHKEVPLCNGEVVLDRSVTMAPRYQCEDEECSVESCLNQFTVLELMTGNNKVVCENCTKRFNQGKEGKMVCTNSTKQYLVSSPPAILILHLKRFEVHRTMFRKISRHVSFPLVLDLAPICSTKCRELKTLSPDQTQVLYALYGVVEHSGTLHGGHYVAYVKVRPPLKPDDPRWTFLPTSEQRRFTGESSAATGGAAEPPPGKWYYVSDSRVNEVQEDRVLHSQAYLLFYERIW